MSWSVRSRSDSGRRFDHHDDGTWTADSETTAELAAPNYAFPLTPTGPVVTVTDERTLFAAAWYVIPRPEVTGDAPSYPARRNEPGRVY